MKIIRFLAIFLAVGFVTYQIANLNQKVREGTELSSQIEIYKVISHESLALRKEADGDSEVLRRLHGIKSGSPAHVVLISKDNDDWWKIQFTSENDEVVIGYASSQYLEMDQEVEAFSLVWNEADGKFEEKDMDSCEETVVNFNKVPLCSLNNGEATYKQVQLQNDEREVTLFSGALLREASEDGAFVVLSNPYTVEDAKAYSFELATVGSIVLLGESDFQNLQNKIVFVPGLDKHIEDGSSIAENFAFESKNSLMKVYNCCFEGQACQNYARLQPRDNILKESLLVPYQGASVYSKLLVSSAADSSDEEESDDESTSDTKQAADEVVATEERRTYTNYEDYFLGPKGVDGRRGGDVYRLNVRNGGGLPLNGPCGSFHYNPERMGGLIGGDRYIKKEVLSCFLGTLQEFRKAHPDANVQWGDIARGDMTDFYSLSGKSLDHSSHKEGRDIDLRPIRSDNKVIGCNIKSNPRCLDRELTQAFIDIAIKYGGNPIYFNDREIRKSSSKISYVDGHYDHFHIRYSEKPCDDVVLDTKYCPTEGFN